MATHIVTLKDNNNDISYPITPVDAVFVDSNTTLADALNDKADADFSNVSAGAIAGTKIADNTITNANVNFASFAVPVYIGRADFNKRTYNNSYLTLENKSDLYAATGVSSQLTNSSLRWEFTLPAGTYVAQVYATLWVGSNSWDYMLMEIQQNDAGFARSMGYRGNGSWGFVNAQGFSALTNGAYFSVRLNTNGNNFSDGNMSSRDSNVQIIIWKIS